MFKRHNQLLTALRVLFDASVVAAAFFGAYALRFGSPITWPYPELPAPSDMRRCHSSTSGTLAVKWFTSRPKSASQAA